MDWYSLLGKINQGASVAKSLLEKEGRLDPSVALGALFDRRISTIDSFHASFEYLTENSYEDYPSLAHRDVYTFQNDRKTKLVLYGYRHPSPKGIVLCVHGLNALSDNHSAAFHDYFLQHGYDVFALDLSACGRSGGFGIPGLHQSALDVASAVAFIHSIAEFSPLPICLFGHSWGAYGVGASLSLNSLPVAACCIAGFEDPWAIMLGLPKSKVGPIAELSQDSVKEAMIARGGDLCFLSASESIENASIPVLLVHGDQDNVTGMKGVSLTAHKYHRRGIEKIIKKGCGHVNVFYPKEVNEYRAKVQEMVAPLKKKYGSAAKLPEEVRAELVSSFSKAMCTQLDQKLFERIEALFAHSCGQRLIG